MNLCQTTSTKEQELKALEQIKSIVATLCPDSYVATAFEGCFEIAEQNIENDWVCSMKQQRDIADKRAIDLGYKVDTLQAKLNAAEIDKRDLRDAIKKAKEDAAREISALQQRVLSDDDITDIIQTIDGVIFEKGIEVDSLASEIVKHADDPNSMEFVNAVVAHRGVSNDVEYYRNLSLRIKASRKIAVEDS